MKIHKTYDFGVKIIGYDTYEDMRGYTAVPFESWEELPFNLMQINHGFSHKKNTLRGLHFQIGTHAQAKLVYCLRGEVYSVAVDIRPESATFGKYVGEVLSFENKKAMYIPKGFAHGYLTLEDETLLQWCVDEMFCAEAAKALRYDDKDITDEQGSKGIKWNVDESDIILSEKDKNGIWLEEIKYCK